MSRTVPPVPDMKRIRRRQIEIGLLVFAGGSVIALALGWTATTAADAQPGGLQVVLVAVFAAEAALAAFGAIVGIGNCRDEIRRARR